MATDKEKTIEVKVAKRKSIDVDGVLYGPGKKLTLPMSEVKDLYDKGFIADPDEDEDEVASAGAGSAVQIEAQ